MGSDESHFNVSAGSDGQCEPVWHSGKTLLRLVSGRTSLRREVMDNVSTNHSLLKRKESRRSEVLPLTNLSNVLPLCQTGSHCLRVTEVPAAAA